MIMAKESIVGVFVIVGLLCVAYLTIKLGKMDVVGTSGYNLEARFNSVSGLKAGADVEIAGVKVGKVVKIRLDSKHPTAIVDLQINNGVGVFDDAIASVKTSGLIGDKYINIDPGGAGDKLKSGDNINDTESSLDIESLISKYVFGKV